MTKTNEKISIRKALAAEDAKLVAVLGAVTFYEAYYEHDDPADLAGYIADAFSTKRIRAEMESPHAAFFIIYADERAVGYAKMRTDSRADCIEEENSIELQRIYILERVFGRGIGETLLKHCLETARRKGFRTLWLGVWEENLRAQRFYIKHGFRRVGTLSFPYGGGEGVNFVKKIDL